MAEPNSSCVILVPALQPPAARCEEGLRELERRGYPVRRVRGFSAIDQGRNEMAAAALRDGFAETMWIDIDIGFEADDVERLRARALPIAAGVYPQVAARALACHLLPNTPQLVFGNEGGLVEIKYAAAGFLLVRREVYEAVCQRLALPLCNTRFGRGVWPLFQPLTVFDDGVHRYLTEDYAFCHRARQAGFKIMADTSIRLWRFGSYPFSWEDAGSEPERLATFHVPAESPRT
jgi:hypothetical protein